MSLSPSNILAKLEELKKWQEKQQERLLEQHHKRLQHNCLSTSDFSYIEQIPTEQVNDTSPSTKMVSRFSKEKLEKSRDYDEIPATDTTKPKQPFLRRGTGLSRFRMTAGEQFKPFTKSNKNYRSTFYKNIHAKSNSSIKDRNEFTNNIFAKKTAKEVGTVKTKPANKSKNVQVDNHKENILRDSNAKGNSDNDGKAQVDKPVITPLKKPDVSVKSKAVWHMTSDVENEVAPAQICTLTSQSSDLIPLSVHNLPTVGSNRTEINQQADRLENESNINSSDRELLIFEALEQRAMQSSFCSTNSSILHLLSSTPSKNTPTKTNHNYDNNTQFQTIYRHQRITDTDDIMQVHYAQNVTQYNQKPHAPVIQEIVEDEVLEENAKIMEENAQTQHDIDEFEKKLQNEYLSLIEKAIKFKQFVAGEKVSSSSASSVTSEDVETTYEDTLQAETNFNDKNKWTDGDMCTSESTSSSPSSNQIWDSQEQKCNAETMTETIADDNSNLALKDKLEELERELKSIRAENSKTSKIKTQLEQQQREFEKHKKEIIKQLEDEKTKINFILEEEKKKLAKEKMVFERYVKDLQNKPSKKERVEIAALKTEIATLKETLKLKETKNGMTQARLRNQIKGLEKENTALKAEIENLNKQNAKLLVNQKLGRKPSDTKILHQINKNITKLTQERQGRQKVKLDKDMLSSDEDDIEYNGEKYVNVLVNSNRSISPGPTTSTYPRKTDILELEKENNKNVINNSISVIETSTRKNLTNSSPIEETYERAFGIKDYVVSRRLSSGSLGENTKNDRVEQILDDGRKEIKYSNGNIKSISPDGNHIVLKYYNGDVKETNLLEGTVRYHYYDSKVNHTTNADGTELIEFPDGQTERRLKDGICEVQYPNGIIRRTEGTGTEQIFYPDGTTVTVNPQGERTLLLPNGQKEVHTNEHKRREYPDGTVKILYPDGLQETRYANGRIRLKDKHGKLLMDSQESDKFDV